MATQLISKIKVYNGAQEMSSAHQFQLGRRMLPAQELFNDFFMYLAPDWLFNSIQQTSLSDADVVVFPAASFANVMEAIYLAKSMREYGDQRPMVVSYIREHIDPQEVFVIQRLLKDTTITLLVNGLTPRTNGVDLPNTIALDAFIAMPVTRSSSDDTTRYKMSVLAGSLRDRIERVYFIAKCAEVGVLDDMFITYNFNDSIERNIWSLITERTKIISTALDVGAFKYNLVNRLGQPIKPEFADTIYTLGDEFHIPPQVINSDFHVVLETRPWASSITEKFYKPLIARVPFVWFACPGLFSWYVNQGYIPHSQINYRFDSIEDKFDRIDAIVEEVVVPIIEGSVKVDTPEDHHICRRNEVIFLHNRAKYDETINPDLLRAFSAT